MAVSVWEAIFMLVVLKIPIVYLGVVVWWAIRAEPRLGASGDDQAGDFVPLVPCGWHDWRRRRPRRPRGGPVPGRPRARLAPGARA